MGLQSRTPAGGGGALYEPDVPKNRGGQQAREPFKCPNGQSYGERLTKGAFWSPATGSSKKDSDRAITPEAQTVCVPARLAPPGSLEARQLCLLLGQSCHRQKKSCICGWRVTSVVSTLCDLLDCGLPGFSVREGSSPGKNSRAYWPRLVAIPF